MENSENKNVSVILIISILFFIGLLVLTSPLCYEGGDNYIHYMYARYAWQYPHLFLHHWGKPVYTILSSPFAQFGFKTAKLFTVLLGISAAYLTFLTACKLGYKQAWLTIIFVCFAPVYFVMFNTTMTEVLFSFILILCVYLFFNNHFHSAAAIISFLPFVRSEGYLFIFIFLFAFVINKKIRPIPLLALGFCLFSLAGYLYYYHNLFWVINENPYHDDAVKIYGTGELLYYIKKYPFITGYAVSFLVLFGIYANIRNALRVQFPISFLKNNELILILYSSIAYISVHSWLYWSGKLSSVGEVRVIAGVIPLLCLCALKGWNFISGVFTFSGRTFLLNGILIFIIIKDSLGVYNLGYKPSGTEEVVIETAEWLKNSKYIKNKIYCYNPLFYMQLDLNPYDTTKFQFGVNDVNSPESNIKIGDIVIWDAHLSPNEGNLPLDHLLKNNHFSLLNLFHPKIPFTVLGGYNYEIYVFQKATGNVNIPGPYILNMIDFENPDKTDSSFVTSITHLGKYSYKLDNVKLYSPTYITTVGELRKAGIKKVIASGYLFPVFDPEINGTALIISFERDTAYNFNLIGLESTRYKMNDWNNISLSCFLPPEAKDSDLMKVFFFQPGKKFIYVDDFKIEAIKVP